VKKWYDFLLSDDEGMPRLLMGALIVLVIVYAIGDMYSHGCSIRLAHGSPLDCESIKDADRRHMCRAVSGSLATECEFIKDGDLKAECRVAVAQRKHKE
jgi:hypothetical protein